MGTRFRRDISCPWFIFNHWRTHYKDYQMEIVIKNFGDKGDINNERIGFNVLATCELKYFLVIRTQKTESGFVNKGTDYFWFLPQLVNVNDKVVLYTKAGQTSVKENLDRKSTRL